MVRLATFSLSRGCCRKVLVAYLLVRTLGLQRLRRSLLLARCQVQGDRNHWLVVLASVAGSWLRGWWWTTLSNSTNPMQSMAYQNLAPSRYRWELELPLTGLSPVLQAGGQEGQRFSAGLEQQRLCLPWCWDRCSLVTAGFHHRVLVHQLAFAGLVMGTAGVEVVIHKDCLDRNWIADNFEVGDHFVAGEDPLDFEKDRPFPFLESWGRHTVQCGVLRHTVDAEEGMS